MTKRIKPELMKLLNQKFQCLEFFDSVDYDQNPKLLNDKIKKFHGHAFSSIERIIIFYHDTGYYQNLINGCSFFLENLYEILKYNDIPGEFVMIITNHYGIKSEIDLLNRKKNYTIKQIIETSLWYDFPDYQKIQKISNKKLIPDIQKLYTCLNNIQRNHRNYTLCKLKENKLLEKGIVSYRFNK